MDKPIEKNSDMEQGPGARLRAAREKLGLSAKDVSKRLHLDVKHIEAIERDEFTDLVAPVFVRGYLRGYARLLSLPPDSIVESYQPEDTDTASIFHGSPDAALVQSGDRPLRWIIAIIILGLIIVPVLWWQTRESLQFWKIESGANLSSQAEPEQESAIPSASSADSLATAPAVPLNDATLPATDAAPAIAPETVIQNDSPPPLLTDPSVPGAEPPTNTAAISPPAATNLPPALTLRLFAESWVEVYDAANTQMIYSLLEEGSTKTIEGFTPPLRILLGNAAGVTVEYNGQTFDHSIYERNGLARFTVGEPVAPGPAANLSE